MRRTEMNTDIIGEGQTGGRGEPLHAAEMTRRGSNRQFGRQFDRATTSLTPYGMSFWALILAACGGGGGGGGPTTSAPAPAAQPKMVEKSGFAYNRPLEGGVAWLDVNENQRIDGQDVRLGTVNAQGEYRGQVPEAHQHKAVMIDTRGTKYANELPDTLLSSPRAQVVSPLTHGLVTGEIKQDDLPNPDEFDPYNDNPYQEPAASEDNSEANREARRELFKAVKEALPLVGRNLSRTESTTPPNGQTPAPAADSPLTEALETLKEEAEGIEFDPVLTRSGSLTLDLAETTSSSAADTGLRFAVTDADGNFTGPPTVSDDRFELRQAGQEWQLWVKPGQTFNANETISLNIIATDTANRTDVERVTFTVGDVQHDPELTLSGTVSLSEGTMSRDTDTGVTFSVTDADSEESGYRPPVVTVTGGNNRFKIVNNRLVAMDDAVFNSGERITLTITATDATNRTDVERVTFTVEAAPAPAQPVIAAPGFTSRPDTARNLDEHETGQGVRVYDADATVGASSSGRVRFSLKDGAPSYLTINADSGVVTLNRAIDLDAGGEASRRVSFTVVATDSADPSRTGEQQVSFTITNSNEQPTDMRVTRTEANASFSESADKANGIELARVTFVDGDPVTIVQSNSARVSAVSGDGHRLGTNDFEVRGGVIYLKATANTAVSANATVTVTVTPVTSGEGTRPSAQDFTFTITNDAPAPAPVNTPPSGRDQVKAGVREGQQVRNGGSG